MQEDEVRRTKDRLRRARYDATDAGRESRRRYNELRQQGYRYLRDQGVPCREAAKHWRAGVAALLADEAANANDKREACG